MAERIRSLSLRFADFLLRHSVVVIGGLVALTVCSFGLMRHLKFDFTPQAIYRGDDDLVAYSEQFKQTFGYDEAVVLVVLASTGSQDVLDAAPLQWQTEIAEAVSEIPGITRVDALATLELPHRTLLGSKLEPLISEVPVTEDVANHVRDLLYNTELVYNGLLSDDDRETAIAIYLAPEKRDLTSMQDVVGTVQQVLEKHPLPEGYRALLSGLPTLRVEIVSDWIRDLLIQIPLASAVYLVLLWLVFRRVSGSVLPVIAVAIGLAWTLAAFALMNESLNFVSNALPALLVIIGISGCTQLVTCYAAESQFAADAQTASRNTIARMAPACLLAALTTVVGFISLMTAKSELLVRFGWQAAIGIAVQYLSTLITLGVLFQYFRPPKPVIVDNTEPGVITRIVTLAGASAARRPWLAIAGGALLATVSLWSGSRVTINTYSILEVLPEQHPAVQTMRLVEHRLAGIMPLEISLQADRDDVFTDPEVFHKVLDVEEHARHLPGVITAQSYADLFREILRSWPGRRVTETDLELVPLNETGRARLKRTFEFADLYSSALHYNSHISSDGQRARIQLRLSEIGSRQTLEVIKDLEQKLSETFPAPGPIQAKLTGEAYVNAKALTVLINDLFYSLLTASFVIFGMIAIEFRSLRVGMIAALPNLTPLTLTLGYMGLRGYDMNVTNVIVFTICLGLADDNTIYFLYRFRQELQVGVTVPEAVRRAFLGTGRAIVLTSVLLLVGLAVLFVSDFVPTRRFAELTTVTILANFFGVLLLLPASLVLLWRSSNTALHSVPAVGVVPVDKGCQPTC